MAYPTQFTLSTGRTVYEGDPDNDEGIRSRQVRVSVTYHVERRDVDLLHEVSVAAREVDAAEVVWQQMRSDGAWSDEASEGQTEMDLMDLSVEATVHLTPSDAPPPDDEDDPLWGQRDSENPDADWLEDDRYRNEASVEDTGDGSDGDGSSDEPPASDPPFYGGDRGDESDGNNNGNGRGGTTPPPYQPSDQSSHQSSHLPSENGVGNGCHGAGQAKACPGHSYSGHSHSDVFNSESMPLPVRKPQKLAIGAAMRRLGLSDVALSALIQERFGKESGTPRYAVDRLTKKEADELLRVLATREWDANHPGQTTGPVPDGQSHG